MTWVERTTLSFITLASAAAVFAVCLASVFASVRLAHAALVDSVVLVLALLAGMIGMGVWQAGSTLLGKRSRQLSAVATFNSRVEAMR